MRNSTDSNPSNWHFRFLAPIYDYFGIEKDYSTVIEALNLPEKGRLLDLGGGTGEFCVALIKEGVIDPDDCTVLDVSPEMLLQAKKKGLPNIIEGDSKTLPLKGSSVDAVFMGDTFHHMGQRSSVLREVKRILKPDGRLVFEEFDPGTLGGKALEYFEWLSGMGSRFFTPDELIGMAGQAGLVTREIKRNGFVYYLTAEHEENVRG